MSACRADGAIFASVTAPFLIDLVTTLSFGALVTAYAAPAIAKTSASTAIAKIGDGILLKIVRI